MASNPFVSLTQAPADRSDALLGVQHFYVYDTSHTAALAAALQFWTSLGLVTLVHPTYTDSAILWGQLITHAID